MRDVCVRLQLSRGHVAGRGSSHMAQAAVPVGGHAGRARGTPDAASRLAGGRAARRDDRNGAPSSPPPRCLAPIAQSVARQAARVASAA